jgi:hypothetical protein
MHQGFEIAKGVLVVMFTLGMVAHDAAIRLCHAKR